MLPHIHIYLPDFLRSPRNLTAVGFAFAAIAFFASYALTRKRVTDAERERARRDYLAAFGRITDGSITETHWLASNPLDPTATASVPAVLLYTYSIGGVIYECAQDVTFLPDHVRHIRIDLPIQVRFEPRNPANSIVVAETWTGLRLSNTAPTPYRPADKTPPQALPLSHHG